MLHSLEQAAKQLEQVKGQVTLDFTAVKRIDSNALRAMEEFARAAEAKGVQVVLRGVDVYVYRVLKLVKLASRFSFENGSHEPAAAEGEPVHAEPSTK